MLSLLTFVIGFIIGVFFISILYILKKPRQSEHLKNALLSYALIKYGKFSIAFIKNYKDYDGTFLPEASGFNTTNACFSYIQSNYQLIFGKFMTESMQDKNKAILKYIDKNLDTNEKVVELFEKLSDNETGNNIIISDYSNKKSKIYLS